MDDITGPPVREEFQGGFAYPNLRLELDEDAGVAALTVVGPTNHECFAPDPGPRRLRSGWWPLAVCRELDDALDVRAPTVRVGHPWSSARGYPLLSPGDVALTSGYEHRPVRPGSRAYWTRMLCPGTRPNSPCIARASPELFRGHPSSNSPSPLTLTSMATPPTRRSRSCSPA